MLGFWRRLTASFRLRTPPATPSARAVRLGGDGLEDRIVPTLSSAEVYGWSVVNRMRADPPKFADELENLYWNRPVTAATAHGVANTDPVWTDIRQTINNGGNPNNFWLALELMRAQPKLGPLGWDVQLEQISDDHNAWVASHAFAHSWWNDPPSNPQPTGFPLPGLPGTGVNGDPDPINPTVLGANFGGWAENIGYDIGASLTATRTSFGTGSAAHRQRQAYADVIGFITEVNSSSLGHLRNLLSRDNAASASGQFGALSALGLDYDTYDAGLTGGTTNFVSTHTLSQRIRPTGAGGYLAGLVYRDLNGNGAYDVGEGVQATVQVSGMASTTYSTTAANFGLVSALLPANGQYTVAVLSGGRTLARQTVTVSNNNVWAEFRFSPNFNLLTEAGAGSTNPTLAADLYDAGTGNNTVATATDLGTFDADSGPPRPTTGLSVHTPADQDWFRFRVTNTTAANIRVAFAHANGNLDATLYRQATGGGWTVVSTANGTTNDEVFAQTLTAGTYAVAVAGAGGATNFYSLTVDLRVDPVPLYTDFGSFGLARHTGGGGWQVLNTANPDGVTTAPDGTLYIDFGAQGIYRWTAVGGYALLNPNNPDGLAAASDGFLYVDYGAFGLARWSAGSGWQLIHGVNPDGIATTDGDLYIDYGIYGLFRWTATAGFTWLNAFNPDGIAAGDGTVFADYGVFGFARLVSLGVWQVIRTDNPDAIAIGSDGFVYASYNSSGIYRSSVVSIAWTRISTNPAERMAVGSDGYLYLDVGVRGLQRYSPLGNWRMLNAANPDGFAVA